jgi:SAM-dependent methyltransferase
MMARVAKAIYLAVGQVICRRQTSVASTVEAVLTRGDSLGFAYHAVREHLRDSLPLPPSSYRETPSERLRAGDLHQLIPKTRQTLLEVGARDGYHSALLAPYFRRVVALDLSPTPSTDASVFSIVGDVTALPFPDHSFDVVLCAEVLEHVSAIEVAVREISRVARHDVLVGVPYRQDTRVGKLTCSTCGRITPAFGHLHSFDEARLRGFFQQFEVREIRLVGTQRERTNAISSWLMTRAGNPWGTYDEQPFCIHCRARVAPPTRRSVGQRLASKLAWYLDRIQNQFVKRTAVWIHVLFSRPPGA